LKQVCGIRELRRPRRAARAPTDYLSTRRRRHYEALLQSAHKSANIHTDTISIYIMIPQQHGICWNIVLGYNFIQS